MAKRTSIRPKAEETVNLEEVVEEVDPRALVEKIVRADHQIELANQARRSALKELSDRLGHARTFSFGGELYQIRVRGGEPYLAQIRGKGVIEL